MLVTIKTSLHLSNPETLLNHKSLPRPRQIYNTWRLEQEEFLYKAYNCRRRGREKRKANTHERALQQSGWHWVTYMSQHTFLFSSSLIHSPSLSLADKLSVSLLVFCPFKKYIELFTLLHAWYCYCQPVSLWIQIREKFLGHVCEICQWIVINADKFLLLYMDMKSYQEFLAPTF